MEVKKCSHCGHRLNPRIEVMNRGLLSLLLQLIEAVKIKGENDIHLRNEMPALTKTQYNNFQKLRYHGLACRSKKRNGAWLVTRLGAKFLRNEKSISKNVYIQNNRIVEWGEEEISIIDFYNKAGKHYSGLHNEEYWQKIFKIPDLDYADQDRLF